jgi:hypothetical protein
MTCLRKEPARKIHHQQAVDPTTTGSMPLECQSLLHAITDTAEDGKRETYSSSKF